MNANFQRDNSPLPQGGPQTAWEERRPARTRRPPGSRADNRAGRAAPRQRRHPGLTCAPDLPIPRARRKDGRGGHDMKRILDAAGGPGFLAGFSPGRPFPSRPSAPPATAAWRAAIVADAATGAILFQKNADDSSAGLLTNAFPLSGLRGVRQERPWSDPVRISRKAWRWRDRACFWTWGRTSAGIRPGDGHRLRQRRRSGAGGAPGRHGGRLCRV